jgi:hypothetical protein
MEDSTIFLWQTQSIKHAFYMASDVLLSYHLSNVFVKAVHSGDVRKYLILLPLLSSADDTKSLVKTLKNDGFLKARVVP